MNMRAQVVSQAPHCACMQQSRRIAPACRTAGQYRPVPAAASNTKFFGGSVSAAALNKPAFSRRSGSGAIQVRALLAQAPPPPNNGGPPVLSPEDQDKEASRKYRRTVFDFSRWRQHRTTDRYRRHILGVWGSRIARGLAGPLWFVAILSTSIGVWETLRDQGVLPAYLPSVSISNAQPFSLSSFALSLLLVFRTNSSYARWDESRKLWGSITNRSRDFVRQAESWVPASEVELLDLIQRWSIAFCWSLQVQLREDGDLQADLEGVLMEQELEALKSTEHRPNYVLQMLSFAVEEAHIPDVARVRMDENLTSFADSLGACERIFKTPIPLTYTRHTSRFLTAYITFVPFSLWHNCGWGTIPASLAIAFLLLGIEEIGVQIEEPFGILPLEAICTTITKNIMEMHTRREEVRSMVRINKPPGQLADTDSRPRHERRRDSYLRSDYVILEKGAKGEMALVDGAVGE